jgi:hypothetical protein
MTPKDKAKELFEKMYFVDDPMGNYPMCFDTAKQCALIAVCEIINSNPHSNPLNTNVESTMSYWQQVKQEIHKTYK